jgi:methionyl-tRNA formyltransferase
MRVLCLGQPSSALEATLRGVGDDIEATTDPIDAAFLQPRDFDFIVSYGYRHIVRNEALELFGERAVNLHISLLPWNRGAHPNVWSVLEDTPSGVSIHAMDEGVDTGPVLAQRGVPLLPGDTLRTSYQRLLEEIETLFAQVWLAVRSGRLAALAQPPGGSAHRVADLEAVSHLLDRGWDTPIEALRGRVRAEHGR